MRADPSLLVEIARCASTPLIDGHFQDWPPASWIVLAPPSATAPPPWSDLRYDGPSEDPYSSDKNADLSGYFALQWDEEWLYLAARMRDNVHDVEGLEQHQWYLKDAISLFLDIPLDGDGLPWRKGDHAFAFVADTTYPPDGRWWRHGSLEGRHELMAPPHTQMAVRPTDQGYALEAAIPMAALTQMTPGWGAPFEGRTIGFMVVATDPDGGPEPFGGQLIYGGYGDNDAFWAKLRFKATGRAAPPQRLIAVPQVSADTLMTDKAFETKLAADRKGVLPHLILRGQTPDQDALAHLRLADEYFQLYLTRRPSPEARRALSFAFYLWGTSKGVEPILVNLHQIPYDEDVWDLVLPGLRQAFYLAGRPDEGLALIETLEARVIPVKSRSVLLHVLATYWLGQGDLGRAQRVFEQIIVWKASLWHIEEALRGLNKIIELKTSWKRVERN